MIRNFRLFFLFLLMHTCWLSFFAENYFISIFAKEQITVMKGMLATIRFTIKSNAPFLLPESGYGQLLKGMIALIKTNNLRFGVTLLQKRCCALNIVLV